MILLRVLLALVTIVIVCPAVLLFVNIVVLYLVQPKNPAMFLFVFVDEYAIPGLVASLLVAVRICHGFLRPPSAR
jgi:hypothetical protein